MSCTTVFVVKHTYFVNLYPGVDGGKYNNKSPMELTQSDIMPMVCKLTPQDVIHMAIVYHPSPVGVKYMHHIIENPFCCFYAHTNLKL